METKQLVNFVIETYHYLDEVSCDTKRGESERGNTKADIEIYFSLFERLVEPKIQQLKEREDEIIGFDYFVVDNNKLLLRFNNPDTYYSVVAVAEKCLELKEV